MKLLIVVITSLFLSPALATNIYYCNGTYTDTPCGQRVKVFNDTPTCDDRVSATKRHYENQIYVIAKEYGAREFELINSYIQAPRITQNTTVTTIGGGASAGASGGDSRSTSGAVSSSNADASNSFNHRR